MPDEAQDTTQLRRMESAEAQAATAELVLLRRLDGLARQARQLSQEAEPKIYESYEILRQIAGQMPALVGFLRAETQEQAVSDAGARRVGAEAGQVAAAARDEAQTDRQEAILLRDMFGKFNDMLRYVDPNRGIDARAKPRMIQDISTIERELPQLINLEKREISDITREQLLSGYKKGTTSYNMVKRERDLVNLLTTMIREMDTTLKQNPQNPLQIRAQAGKLKGLLNRARAVVEELVKLNQAEARTI